MMINDNDNTYSKELQENLEPIPDNNKQVEYFNPHTADIKQEVILIGSDHRGFDLKLHIREHLVKRHYDVLDVGTHNKDRCDYPNVAKQLCKTMNSKKGILICGSGFGMCISANRYKGIHAVTPRSVEEAIISRQHGNVNVLCMGADFTTKEDGVKIVDAFLNTAFEELETSRYSQRIRMIDNE